MEANKVVLPMEALLAGHKAVLGMGSAAFSQALTFAGPLLSAGAAIGVPVLHSLRGVVASQNEVFRSLEWTVMKIPGSDEFVETYFNQGLALRDFTTAKYVATFFMAYAIMAVVPWLPRGAARSLWCFITGLLMTQFVFGVAYLHIALTTIGCYAILALGQSVPALRQWAHLLSGLAVFGYLCLRHLTRSNVNASSVDDSIMQMVLTVKLYTLSFNLFDGTVDAKRIDAVLAKSKDDATKRGEVNMLKDRKTRAITALPSLLDVLGYAFNPSTVMAGPAFEFGMYADGINRESLPENAPRALAVVVKFVLGLVTLAVSALFKNVISVDGIFSHLTAVNAGTPAPSAFYRFAYMYVAFVLIRGQYYGVWKLSEGAAVLGGFGLRAPALAKNAVSVFAEVEWLVGHANLRYILSFLGSSYETTLSSGLGVKLSGSPDAPDWEGASNVTPFTVETRHEAGHSVRTWNLHVQSWLDRCVCCAGAPPSRLAASPRCPSPRAATSTAARPAPTPSGSPSSPPPSGTASTPATTWAS